MIYENSHPYTSEWECFKSWSKAKQLTLKTIILHLPIIIILSARNFGTNGTIRFSISPDNSDVSSHDEHLDQFWKKKFHLKARLSESYDYDNPQNNEVKCLYSCNLLLSWKKEGCTWGSMRCVPLIYIERTIANPLYEQKTIIATSLIKNFQTL